MEHDEYIQLHERIFAASWGELAPLADEIEADEPMPGPFADLVVLDRDPYETRPDKLNRIGVVATMVGGEWVHGGPPRGG